MAGLGKVYAVPSILHVALYGAEIAGKKALVSAIQKGDKVTALFPAGIGSNGPEFKERSGYVNPMLIFPDHVVIDLGGKHGTPGVVNAENIVSVKRKAGA